MWWHLCCLLKLPSHTVPFHTPDTVQESLHKCYTWSEVWVFEICVKKHRADEMGKVFGWAHAPWVISSRKDLSIIGGRGKKRLFVWATMLILIAWHVCVWEEPLLAALKTMLMLHNWINRHNWKRMTKIIKCRVFHEAEQAVYCTLIGVVNFLVCRQLNLKADIHGRTLASHQTPRD